MRFLGALCAFLLFGAATAHAQESASPPTTPQFTLDEYVALAMEEDSAAALAQCDPRWGNERIGNGTVCKQGCMFMSYVPALIEAGYATDPNDALALFKREKLIDPRGRLLTQKIAERFPELGIVKRERASFSALTVEKVAEALLARNHVLLKVSDPRRGILQHWVNAVAAKDGIITILDPRGGTKASFTDLYAQHALRELLELGNK
ncbi:MAG TPA: hypothetical protein VHO23_02730 [Candidatus Paceibacterota bacterium]|nr:hypothetical protein [Candidatus Paceibacterota bacterium]